MTEKHFTLRNPFAGPKQNLYNLLHIPNGSESSSNGSSATPSRAALNSGSDMSLSPGPSSGPVSAGRRGSNSAGSALMAVDTNSRTDMPGDVGGQETDTLGPLPSEQEVNASILNSQPPLRPTTTADSYLSTLSRVESNGFGPTNTNNLYSYCLGKPRNLISSHSGTVTLALSVQEPAVFLSCCPPGALSYRDLGIDTAGNTVDRHPSPDISIPSPSEPTSAAAKARSRVGLGPRNSNQPGQNESSNSGSTFPRISTTTTSTNPLAPSSSNNNGSSSSASTNTSANHTHGQSPPPERLSDQSPSTLRGSILLKLTKPTKLKQISLSFYGISKTVWSQTNKMTPLEEMHNQPGAEVQDLVFVNSHDWEFLPEGSSTQGSGDSDQSLTTITTDLYGADAVLLKSNTGGEDTVRVKDCSRSTISHNSATRTVADSNNEIPLFAPRLTPKRKHRHPATASHKEAVLFPAGEYVYNFTLAIDASTPETVHVPHGSIQYFLVPKVVRSGAFTLNLQEKQEVELIRSPPNNYDTSFNNPIVISRIWDSRLHYEIVIPQKYVTLGTSIPVAIKLTPLEKVMVHRVRIQVYETTQYKYSPEPHIECTEISLKVALYERKATTNGVVELTDSGTIQVGQKTPDDGMRKAIPAHMIEDDFYPSSSRSASAASRSSAPTGSNSNAASNGNSRTASAGLSSSSEENIVAGSHLDDNNSHRKLSGNLLNTGRGYDTDCEESTSTYFNCTIPLVSNKETWPAEKLPAQYANVPGTPIPNSSVQYLRPDSISSPYIRVRHRLVVSFRISKQDIDDEKRRHFEVKVDTPINLLSAKCIGGNVELPRYDNFSVDQYISPDGPLGNLPSFDDALAAITDDELYVRPPITQAPAVPSPPPEYSSLDFE
ncbi:Aly2p [Sugiyamaella lignohabitans]|uniref:Aly2p n=1 Tax=Sugiyamaella lignohabitans TaxID=796027 RepID=A0A161HKU3_9ASCO|nr:Aly2p [Sugiyamaella lignohabitans]ANB12488.1 Aly2p [Sugiyamaella lignohabitans]